jgi:hypothetical protein
MFWFLLHLSYTALHSLVPSLEILFVHTVDSIEWIASSLSQFDLQLAL